MDSSTKNTLVTGTASGEFEATLRMIASLPAPAGLEERVEAGLRAAPQTAPGRARILAWPVALRMDSAWVHSSLARSAAAAAIVAVVVGGGWGVYSRVQLNQPARLVLPLRAAPQQGGFSSAGAKRTPQTLDGPVVVPPAAVPAAETKAAPKIPAQTPLHRSKAAAAQKAIAPPEPIATPSAPVAK
ncbi:MAG: hypothetical protein ABSC48_18040 [Terracidiphilus sp.]